MVFLTMSIYLLKRQVIYFTFIYLRGKAFWLESKKSKLIIMNYNIIQYSF